MGREGKVGFGKMTELLEFLSSLPAGAVTEIRKLERVLASCWDEFEGSHADGMMGRKLLDRIEEARWNPPYLTFTIERHGAFFLGSSRAERYEWKLNTDGRTASSQQIGYRQHRPISSRLDVKPLANEIENLILERRADDRLRWDGDERVRVKIGMIIPDDGPQQTVSGRRKRFRTELTKLLVLKGWEEVRPNVYKR
jgi:hypothetical protein